MGGSAMTRKDPLKTVMSQSIHGSDRLGPRIPVVSPEGYQVAVIRRPGQVISREQESVSVEENRVATRVARCRDRRKIVIQSNNRLAFQKPLGRVAARRATAVAVQALGAEILSTTLTLALGRAFVVHAAPVGFVWSIIFHIL